MSFVHFASRSLLAGYFVADGVTAVIDPEPLVPLAEPVRDHLLGHVERFWPDALAGRSPVETTTLIRFHGAVQAVAGLLMAAGIARRPAALVMAASYLPRIIMGYQPDDPDKLKLARELALIGGALIVSRDTQGKPSRGWLAAERRRTAVARSRRGAATPPAGSR